MAQQRTPATAPAQPAVPPPASPSQQQQSQPQLIRTEALNFDNWTSTCRDYANPASRQCNATLQLIQVNQQTSQSNVIITWIVSLESGRLTSVVQVPSGVSIQPGVEIKVGATVRQAAFVRCEPQRCDANLPIDDALSREFSGANEADVTVAGSQGGSVTFKVPLRGYDRAVQALRR